MSNALVFVPQVSLECVKNGFTQSELSLFDECAMKWNLRYNNQLTRNVFDWNFFVGGAWHNFQEQWRKCRGTYDVTNFMIPAIPTNTIRDSEFEQNLEYWSEVLPAYQLAYSRIYAGEEKEDYKIIEEELFWDFHGYKIRGKIDLASDKHRYIRDFKSTKSAWLISPSGWHFKLQFMLYCWLMSKVYPEFVGKGFAFQMDTMQKPGLKQTKADGTWQGHIRRVVKDVHERARDFYFTREQVMISPDQIKRFEETVLTPKIELLALAINNPEEGVSIVTNMNTNACNSFGKPCEFFEICEKGFNVGRHFFSRRPVKHQEL